MNTIKHKLIYAAIAIILLAGAGSLILANEYLNKEDIENYQTAEIRCGQKPVIGSDEPEGAGGKVYYEPGPSGKNMSYRLLSKYDPANLDISSYSHPKFFCSVNEAKAAGYGKHACCGVVPLRD